MRVIVRVRPLNSRETNQQNIVKILDHQSLIFDPDDNENKFGRTGSNQKRANKKLYSKYDEVYGPESTNIQIFNKSMKPLMQSLMDGFNCSVFVYGATGSGKTHTVLGNKNSFGIAFLAIEELFHQMEHLKENREFDIGVSYVEVYNEKVMDLLTKKGPLKLHEDSKGQVGVTGLILKKIDNADQLYGLLNLGNKNRTQHPTDRNSESSRSHAIFQIHIRMIDRNTSMERTVKLSMIDLAGSETVVSTKCVGLRFKEGASINKSLLTLGHCINNLADGSKHIPYR